MRTNSFYFTTLFIALAAAACGGGGSSSGSGSGGTDDQTGVTGTAKDIYKPTTGDVTVPNTTSWTSIEAIVGDGADAKSYPGNIDAQGNIDIPNVPPGTYRLVLTSAPRADLPGAKPFKTVIETDARVLDLGRVYSYRPDLKETTKPTSLALSGDLGVPFQVYSDDGLGNVQPLDDQLDFVSQNASVYGNWSSTQDSATGGPKNGDKQLAGWTEDVQETWFGVGDFPHPLLDSAKGDSVTILHQVRQSVGTATADGDPWKGYTFISVQEAAAPAPFTMTDGGTSSVTTSFKAVPQKTFDLDYKGSAWTSLVTDVPFTTSYLDISVSHEFGAPDPAVGTFASLLDIYLFPGTAYSNPDPACQGDACDAVACPTECDPGASVLVYGDHKHTYSYGNPFSGGQELSSANFGFRVRVTQLLGENTSNFLRGYVYVSGAASEMSGKPLSPVIGIPKDIKVAGAAMPYDQVDEGVGLTPTITWSPPAVGTPTHYRINVVNLKDVTTSDGTVLTRLNVATIRTKGTSAQVPEGVMEASGYYYFEVAAYVGDDDDLAEPFRNPVNLAIGQMFTGVVSP